MALRTVGRLLRRGRPPTLPTSDAYALWAATYPPHPHNAVMETEQATVAPLLAKARPRRALDVGTGTGRYLPHLTRTGARLTVGIDLSMAMLTRSRHPAPVICADACRLPFRDGSFDLVTGFLTVGDVRHLDRWVGEIARVLAPGGQLLYSDFHPAWTARRWQRTFTAADGQSFAVPFYPHKLDDHAAALRRHGMLIRRICEPSITVPARWPRRGQTMPALVVFQVVKQRGMSASIG